MTLPAEVWSFSAKELSSDNAGGLKLALARATR